MNRVRLASCALLVVVAVSGCGAGASTGGGTSARGNTSGQAPSQLVNIQAPPVSQIQLIDTSMPGYKLFQQTCASCHGPKGQGAFGPTIYGIGKYWNTKQITAFVEQGRGSMPPRGGLTSDAEVKQVVAWLEKQGK